MKTKYLVPAWYDCEKCGRSDIGNIGIPCKDGCLYNIPVFAEPDVLVNKEDFHYVNMGLMIEGAD